MIGFGSNFAALLMFEQRTFLVHMFQQLTGHVYVCGDVFLGDRYRKRGFSHCEVIETCLVDDMLIIM